MKQLGVNESFNYFYSSGYITKHKMLFSQSMSLVFVYAGFIKEPCKGRI